MNAAVESRNLIILKQSLVVPVLVCDRSEVGASVTARTRPQEQQQQ
jgi:hypothetical protein